jgi:hypothetical protein
MNSNIKKYEYPDFGKAPDKCQFCGAEWIHNEVGRIYQCGARTLNGGSRSHLCKDRQISQLLKPKPLRLIDIDTETQEGRLLVTALAFLSTNPGFASKTPDNILAKLDGISREIYGE